MESLAGLEKTVDRLIATAKKIGFKSADEISEHSAIVERWSSNLKTLRIEEASVINKAYGEPPYLAGTKVAEMETTAAETFVRVHGPDIAAGRWVKRETDVANLSAKEIAETAKRCSRIEYAVPLA